MFKGVETKSDSRPAVSRIRRALRFLKAQLLHTRIGFSLLSRLGLISANNRYRRWLELNAPSADALAAMRRESCAFAYRPLISVVVPTYNSKREWLHELVRSVQEQTYPFWELCIADDASPHAHVAEMLRALETEDSRIRVVYRPSNGHIAEATNSALAIAKGEFAAFIDHDDLISPDALFEVAQFLNRQPDTDLLYSNEDKLDAGGNRCQPTFKPEWSPDYFRSFMYLGHLAVYRLALVRSVGGFRKGTEGSQDYDLALRVVARGAKVRHIDKVLYHWRMHPASVAANQDSKPYAFEAALRVHREALRADGETAPRVDTTPLRGIYRPRYSVPHGTPVLVCPWRRGPQAAAQLKSDYPFLEHSPETVPFEEGLHPLAQILSRSQAPFVLLVEQRIQPITASWVEELLEQALGSRAAAVGPKIVCPRGRVLHAGYSVLPPRLVSNFFGAAPAAQGYAGRLVTAHNVAALSAACLLANREALIQALTARFASCAAWETALSFELRRAGYLTWTPHVRVESRPELFSAAVDLRQAPEDLARLNQHYGFDSFQDPFYPRGLDRARGDFSLPFPPPE